MRLLPCYENACKDFNPPTAHELTLRKLGEQVLASHPVSTPNRKLQRSCSYDLKPVFANALRKNAGSLEKGSSSPVIVTISEPAETEHTRGRAERHFFCCRCELLKSYMIRTLKLGVKCKLREACPASATTVYRNPKATVTCMGIPSIRPGRLAWDKTVGAGINWCPRSATWSPAECISSCTQCFSVRAWSL